MAFDFFAVVSRGAYSTPGTGSKRRSVLAASYGLLNFDLPEGSGVVQTLINIMNVGSKIGMWGISLVNGIFNIGRKK